jgi:hypothetical protein
MNAFHLAQQLCAGEPQAAAAVGALADMRSAGIAWAADPSVANEASLRAAIADAGHQPNTIEA